MTREAAEQAFASEMAGRVVAASCLLTEGAVARFDADGEVHQLRLRLDEAVPHGTGVTACYRLEGWARIGYVAVGYTVEGTFRHLKARHVRQGRRNVLTLALDDLAFGVRNQFPDVEPSRIVDVRLYVRGTPGPEGATLEVFWAAAFDARSDLTSSVRQGAVTEALERYLRACSPGIEEGAEAFLRDGSYPVQPGIQLAWPAGAVVPPEVAESRTYRYRWHSLLPAAHLMLHAEDTGSAPARAESVRQVTDWIDRNLLTVSDDLRFAWYDHGVAERALALVCVRSHLDEATADAPSRVRIDEVIAAHGRLLESEAFYAVRQVSRYHNHALFQDVALLVVAQFVPDAVGRRWTGTALARLEDQLDHLLSREGEYAVLVENSPYYHHWMVRLLTLAADVLDAAGVEHGLAEDLAAMMRWSQTCRYANGGEPALGDSFRVSNATPAVHRGPQPEEVVVLPASGYALVRGNHAGTAYTLTMVATSLSRTHKHEDNLAVTLDYGGVEWLIDPSFHSHAYTDPVPAYLRSAEAHSCVEIPGEEYSLEPGLTRLSLAARSGSEYAVAGRHVAYPRHEVSREIAGRTDRLDVCVTDELLGPPAAAVLTLHLGEGVQAVCAGTTVTLTHPALPELGLEVALPGPPKAVDSIAGTSFGCCEPTTSVRVPLDAPGRVTWRLRAVVRSALSTARR